MEQYKTMDIWLAAYLMCRGCKVLGVNRTQGDRPRYATILFEDEDKCKTEIVGYINDTTLVAPKSMKTAYQSLKDMIFDGAGTVGG